uniref:protein kinase domain-containing protein n=1 Tax=Agathobacter sp. TaxID=2021311 RepID=UPI004056E138
MQLTIHSILFGKYEILSQLGAGSFSTVYLARHIILESYRAIKLIPKQNSPADSLLTEANILKSLRHSGIPIIYEIEEDTSCYYLIEEFIEGESLDTFLFHQKVISPTIFYNLSLQLCDIFLYLHSIRPYPILYMDLKPEHIIICGMELKLIDFNVSAYIKKSGNLFHLFGNEDFSAPEIKEGAIPNLQWDIYSIGKLMLYLSDFVKNPLSSNTQKIIKQAASTDLAFRFETVEQLISALSYEQTLQNRPHSRKTIAVIGSHKGCGCTHISISLTSTLNYMGYSTCYYEKNDTEYLFRAAALLPHKEEKGCIFYRFFKGYPNYGPGILLPEPEADFAVFNYGTVADLSDIETDLYLYIAGNSFWHRQDVIDKNKIFLHFKGNRKIICNMGTKSTLFVLANRLKTPIFHFPYDENPFLVTSSKVKFASELLNLNRRASLFFRLKKLFMRKKS